MSEQDHQKRENQYNSQNSERNKEKSIMIPNKTSSSNDMIKKEERIRTRGKKSITCTCDDGKEGGKPNDHHEGHIWAERERRNRLRNKFSTLHALLPHLPSKADKSTIVEEAVNYIKTLEQTLDKLEKLKLQRLRSTVTTFGHPYGNSREAFIADQVSSSSSSIANSSPSTVPHYPVGFETWVSPNVVLNICGIDVQFNVCCSPEKQGLFSTICDVLEKHNIEVLSAHISSDNNQSLFMIQAQANNQVGEAFSVDKTFKQAAEEIVLCLS